MIYIKIFFYLLLILLFAVFTFQNLATLTYNLHINFFSQKNITIPLYYLLIIWILILFLIVIIFKIKNTFLLSKRDRVIKKLEKEIGELKKLNISEESENE